MATKAYKYLLPAKSHSLLAEMAKDKITALTRDGRPPIHASVIAMTHGDREAPGALAFSALSRLGLSHDINLGSSR